MGNNVNGKFLKAEANNSASGLGKEIKINLKETPFLNITWKVEKDLPGIDEDSKKGHDYAARVYIEKNIGQCLLCHSHHRTTLQVPNHLILSGQPNQVNTEY